MTFFGDDFFGRCPAGASAGIAWFAPDMADLMTGATIMPGNSVTVTTAWAFSGNRVTAETSNGAVINGIRETYNAVMTRAKYLELLADVGTTDADLITGNHSLLVWMLPALHPGKRAMVVGGIVDDSAQASLNGVAGGYRASLTAGEVVASTCGVTADADAVGITTEIGDGFLSTHRNAVDDPIVRTIGVDVSAELLANHSTTTGVNASTNVHTFALCAGKDSLSGVTAECIVDFEVWFSYVDNALVDLPT